MKFRERYHYLFKQSFGPLCKVKEYEDQRCLLLFLLELKRHREKLLKDNSTIIEAHPQRTITATTPSSDTQMGSWSGHKKGDIIDRATAICSACWPSPHAARPQHPCHRQIRAIISLHRRCFPCFGDPLDCRGQARWRLSFPDHRPEFSWRCILCDFSDH